LFQFEQIFHKCEGLEFNTKLPLHCYQTLFHAVTFIIFYPTILHLYLMLSSFGSCLFFSWFYPTLDHYYQTSAVKLYCNHFRVCSTN